MAGQETGKQRASRIPLDYYKHPDWVQRWKLRLTVIAVVLAIAWCGASLVGAGQGNRTFSRGPVASVHAAWDAECSACHVPFKPMGQNAGVSTLIGGAHASDALCTNCHAGPPHSNRQKPAEVQACASCHRDHRGREASLVQLADKDCTRCHADLNLHVAQGVAKYENNVSLFAKGKHPDFRPLRSQDPGRLKFNHKLHMAPGQVLTSDGKPWRLADIADPAERERYRNQMRSTTPSDDVPVQLSCASCHQLDSGDFAANLPADSPAKVLLPPRAAGAYMLPITYDNQCKACHPLTVEPATKGSKPLTVPHRMEPDALRDFLVNAYVGRYIAGSGAALLDAPLPKRTRPGEAPEPVKPSPEQEKAKTAIAEQVLNAEKILYLGKQTCGECHYYTAPPGDGLRVDARPSFKIEPPQVPSVWFTHAKFNHVSHKALDCKACHARAYPDDPQASTVAADVMIPGIDNCIQCHAPSSDSGGKPQGGVRFGCTECHSYHHGDAAPAGLGAAARKPQRTLTIQEFLSGKP
jgi:predicted CXXCH cytochrome family protein